MRWLELRVPPVLVGLAFAAAIYGVSTFLPSLSYVIPILPLAAFPVAAAGILIALAGVIAFRRHRTTVNPLNPDQSSSVVTTGVYGVSRNPMYLGLLLVLVAWAMYLSHPVAALLLPGFALYMNRFQIKPEERALLSKFGAQFEQYMTRVRRWA